MNKKKQRKENEFHECAFCGQPSNEKKCGKLFLSKLHGFAVHQYCMFFSAALPQNGKDHEGFEGFLEQDVLKEIRRAGRLRCCVCLKKGASAGCCDENCRRGFHFTCGVDHKYLFQFYGEFRAYCVDHRPHQNSTRSYPSKKVPCPICLEPVPCYASPDILTTPCCKDTWFHRSCVQEQAVVSGYFFRCAVCNDTEKFVQEMKRMGIFVPDRDAAWEEGNNFAELLEKYVHCDNQTCKCPLGRTYANDSGQWELLLCKSCGQYGTHVGCRNWFTKPPSLLCPTCRPVHEDPTPCMTRAVANVQSSIQEGSPAKLPATKKGRGRRKRHHVDSDTDSDDISSVLNGLRRQAQNDLLNSDTNFFVQRALAAGTAAMEHSAPKKRKPSERGQSSIPSHRERNTENRIASEESDDEIMITKYVPGEKPKCEFCPKCNRRKPINSQTSSPGRNPRMFVSSTGSSSTISRNSGSSCTMTKADMERKSAKNGSTEYERSDRTERWKLKVADYEVLEFAAEHTNKSSVLVIHTDKKTTAIDKARKQAKNGIISSSHHDVIYGSQNGSQKAILPTSNTFWLSSVERLLQFLNPRSIPEPAEEINDETEKRGTSEGARSAMAASRKSSKDSCDDVLESSGKISIGGNTESVEKSQAGVVTLRLKEQCMSSTEKSEVQEGSTSHGHYSETIDLTSEKSLDASGDKLASSRERMETAGESSDVAGVSSKTTGENQGPDCNGKSSVSNSLGNVGKTRLCTRSGDKSKEGCEFLSKKAVLEAAIDRAMEMKRSGKEMKHRCVPSF